MEEGILKLLEKQQAMMASLHETMEQQKAQHKEEMAQLAQRLNPGASTSEATAPKFDSFIKSKEKWGQYLQRFNHHLAIYGISNMEKKRACLLSWVGPETYSLLRNLFGAADVSAQTFDALTEKLSTHFKDSIHVQAARYEFYNCKMQPGQSYADWIATLRGISKDCNFICSRDGCDQSYVDELMRDLIIKETPHADVRRHCLTQTNPSLDDVLKVAATYVRTLETDRVIQGESNGKDTSIVNKMTGSYQKGKKPSKSIQGNFPERLKSCSRCFIDHQRKDCQYRHAVCQKCGRKGHIKPVCMSTKPSITQQVTSVNFCSVPLLSFDIDQLYRRVGNQLWINSSINGIPLPTQWDTGAPSAMVGLTGYKTLGSPKLSAYHCSFVAYGDKPLKVKGICTVTVQVGSEVRVGLKLVVLDEHRGQNIFGLDWSDAFSMTAKGTSALDAISSQMVKSQSCNTIDISDSNDKLVSFQSKFPSVFSNVLGRCTKTKVTIHLKPNAKPVFNKPRPLPFARQIAVQTELDRLVNQGILEPINYSDWAAPIVAVTKSNGSVRICGDFKALNQQIQIDQHPLPSLDEILHKLQGGCIFTKIDLADAYFQLELDDDAKNLCVINTQFGLFRYRRMCFGVASSPANFQRCIDAMIAGLPGVASFIDDIIVTGIDERDHFRNLSLLFERLTEYGFTVNFAKCEFFKSSIEYLGHIIDKDGKRPSHKSVEAIKQLPKPQDVRQLQAFLGKVNYYRAFIPNFTNKAAALYRLLQKDAKFIWNTDCDAAFRILKNDVIDATQLAHYDVNKQLILSTDASQFGIGAVLSIEHNGEERPIAHASKTLSDSQKSYSQIEKEALSIIYGVTKFRQFLYGRKFTLVTDHKPLLAIFSPDKKIPVITAQRLQRWALTLMAYQYDIRYKPTNQHGNADGLSRLPKGPDPEFDELEIRENAEIVHAINMAFDGLPLTRNEIRDATLKDKTMKLVKLSVTHGNWNPKTHIDDFSWFSTRKHSLSLHEDIVMLNIDGFQRVVIPQSLRSRVLSLLHEGHWGIAKMKQMARRYIAWPSINRDIENLVKSCDACRKVMKAPDRQYREWPKTSESFERIHLDFAGPINNKMFLVIVDAHSKYPFVKVMNVGSTTTLCVVNALREVFSIEGLPVTIVTDGGPQFTSNEFDTFCSNLAISHIVSPSFHPASNGEAERFVQTLKAGLIKNCDGGKDLNFALQTLLATYRCAPHPGIDWKTPAEILHGRQPRNLLSLCSPFDKSKPVTPRQSVTHFEIGSSVYARSYRSGPKWVAGVVTEILGRVVYIIKTDHGYWRRHKNQLQPRLISAGHNNTATQEVAQPPQSQAEQPLVRNRAQGPATSPARTSGRRYPLRIRTQTDFYRPT